MLSAKDVPSVQSGVGIAINAEGGRILGNGMDSTGARLGEKQTKPVSPAVIFRVWHEQRKDHLHMCVRKVEVFQLGLSLSLQLVSF